MVVYSGFSWYHFTSNNGAADECVFIVRTIKKNPPHRRRRDGGLTLTHVILITIENISIGFDFGVLSP